MTISTFDLHVYSIAILLFLFVHIMTSKQLRSSYSGKLFTYVLIAMFANTVLDFIGWYFILGEFTTPGAQAVNFWLNTLIFSTLSLPMSFWLIYIDFKIYNDKAALKKKLFYYFSPTLLQVILMIVNISTGIIFSIQEGNVYTRGSGFYIVVLTMYMLPAVTISMVIKNRKTVTVKLVETILIFWIVPIIAGVLQIFYYGVMITWPVFVLVTLFTYILIEKESMLKDPLTQLDTRSVFNEKANDLIKRSIPYALIMIDMNDFKSINDTYGHNEGDEALILTSYILKNSIKGTDTLCRLGGDEFIIISPVSCTNDCASIVESIKKNLSDFNNWTTKPYKLKMSIGCKYFDHKDHLSVGDMLAQVDELIYADKVESKS